MKTDYKIMRFAAAILLMSVLPACAAPESPSVSLSLPAGFDPFEIGNVLSDMEKELLKEMNFVRQKPKQFGLLLQSIWSMMVYPAADTGKTF